MSSTAMETVLVADDVSRWYGQVIGVQGVQCEVGPGITGLLGLNGAGKSTLFKVLAGQIAPSKGRVLVFGHDLGSSRGLYHRIGFCPEPDALYEFMTGHEMLMYLLRLQGFSKSEASARADKALSRCHLTDAAHRRVAGYSKGMRQKIKLAQAMAHDPDVMFLDEPFNGMDPVSRHESMELIRELGKEGKTILLSSHLLHEVEAMTSTIMLITNGRIRAHGHFTEIRDHLENLENEPLRIEVDCSNARELAVNLIASEDVQAVQVEADDRLIVSSTRSSRFFKHLPHVALEAEVDIRGYRTLDDDLKSLFAYLVEGTQ